MELKERVTLDMLTPESVSVLKQQFITVNGVEMQVGSNERNSFSNTKEDREVLKNVLSDEYYAAVIAMWGEDNEEENEYDDSQT
nr:MAG TPA: hypothetical protein [Caudoviricetes sp.]